ncbi:E3 ubiquitin-protein ligase RNF43, partial [Mucuna pruriens]
MELDVFELYLNRVQESSLSIPVDSPNGDQFYIYFEYVHHQITPSPTEPDAESITTINRTLLVPQTARNTTPIGEYAWEMVAAHQGHNVWEMRVMLHVTSWPDEDDDDDDDYIDLNEHQYVLQSTSQIAESTSQIVDLLKEVESTELPFYSTDQCAICLEEFCTGSKLEVVSTECLHVFHKECIIQWLQKCTFRSCPLCRCLLKSKSV